MFLDRLYVEEAELTLSLISSFETNETTTFLEAGAGVGFIYCYLKSEGFNVVGIEPSISGFEGYNKVSASLFEIAKVSGDSWFNYSIEDCEKLNQTFDYIFSNNVLEHTKDLGVCIKSLNKVLKSKGVMVHNTPNYSVPYEPHFQMLLVPFFPKLTSVFKPTLKESNLWNELNFITVGALRQVCKKENLGIEFEEGFVKKTFERFDYDEQFKKRQMFLFRVYKLLKITKLFVLLNFVPLFLTTPIIYRIRKLN